MDLLWAVRPIHAGMLNYYGAGGARYLAEAVYNQFRHTPRWRVVRRFHLKRQLALAAFADECIRIGYTRCVKGF